jgi:mevalonate pyrophosphate decarboxylase
MTKIARLKLNKETVRQLARGASGTAAAASFDGCTSRYPCPIQSYYAACPPSMDTACTQCVE